MTYKNKEQQQAYVTRYVTDLRRKRRSEAIEKLGGKCVKCGTEENLDFDHIENATKIEAIGSMLTAPIERLNDELNKCQLLCKSCHIQKTKEYRELNGHELANQVRCELVGAAILTEEQVREIRKSTLSQRALGREYGVDKSTIGAIKRFVTWKHVE